MSAGGVGDSPMDAHRDLTQVLLRLQRHLDEASRAHSRGECGDAKHALGHVLTDAMHADGLATDLAWAAGS